MRLGFDVGSDTIKTVIIDIDGIRDLPIVQIQGRPLEKVLDILKQNMEEFQGKTITCGVTGSGAGLLAEILKIDMIHEPTAMLAAFSQLYPDVRTVIEMGREAQKYLLFEQGPHGLLLLDSNLGNKCASGSGSFLDHMAVRLNYETISEFAQVAFECENPAGLSGRCAVFTESDITHLYQKGTPKDRIAAGIHQAVSRNYRSAIARGKEFKDKIAFIGGVSENIAAKKYLEQELEIGELFVPKHNRTMGAIGAALKAEKNLDLAQALSILEDQIAKPLEYASLNSIVLAQSDIQDLIGTFQSPSHTREEVLAALGRPTDDKGVIYFERVGLAIDIGSVSTKIAIVVEIEGCWYILASWYRRTNGDPLVAVKDVLFQVKSQLEAKNYKAGRVNAATTGSGRYLTADYIGADLVRNEITAQASGAQAYASDVDTIFEIGGQDSKYIRLDGDVIVDFEMNKACAAGTGAFLEKQAQRLGVALEDFGEVSLKNTRPPDLDWTCTVFSESAMVYFQQNNVPVEDLAAGICIASVKNYLHKNVASREIGKKVAFQGAVAFNKGMVAAYETILGREIVVPPYPHLTGAVGAARLAYLSDIEEPTFKGFEKILESEYELGSFECKSCANRCDVNTFQAEGGPKYFYNDRCEKFSAAHKKNLGAGLPDLLGEREELLAELCSDNGPETAPEIGIPRGLMYSEHYPLYFGFARGLGFSVVSSAPTNKQIVQKGLDVAIGEPCFPFKVAHGHYANLIERGVDTIFAPRVISTEQPNPNLTHAQTCPYLQGAPDAIGACVGLEEKGVKQVNPVLHFSRGKESLKKAFVKAGKELGKSKSLSAQAFEEGWELYLEFRRRIEARGKEVMASLKPNQQAFIVCGRPYSLYDPAVSMDIGKKIQDLGILAIPQDYLPLESVDISDCWSNNYSRQIQKKLMAARLIRHDVRFRAIVVTYFACGPDSFGNPFFKDEIGEPCYVMQIDEHTADAGVITRIEAFADTAGKGNKIELFNIRTDSVGITQIGSRRLWVPYANEGARVVAKAMQCKGINAEVLPVSPDPSMNLARSAISEDVCLPAFCTTEDMLYRAQQPDFQASEEAFFQGNSDGPCRFGMYSMLQRRILDKMGLTDVPMVTLGSKGAHEGLGLRFGLLAADTLYVHDLLERMYYRARPYEIVKGSTKRLFLNYIDRVLTIMDEHYQWIEDHPRSCFTKTEERLEKFFGLLQCAEAQFSNHRDENAPPKPIVGVVGEFYVRLHGRANQDILSSLNKEGVETWLSPLMEFFSYSREVDEWLAKDIIGELGLTKERLGKWLGRKAETRLLRNIEHHLYPATLPLLDGLPDIEAHEVIRLGSKDVDYNFGGELICSVAKARDLISRGIDGIVNVIPFNCMPGNQANAVLTKISRETGIPVVTIDYNGFTDSARESRVVNFCYQVKERFQSRQSVK